MKAQVSTVELLGGFWKPVFCVLQLLWSNSQLDTLDPTDPESSEHLMHHIHSLRRIYFEGRVRPNYVTSKSTNKHMCMYIYIYIYTCTCI